MKAVSATTKHPAALAAPLLAGALLLAAGLPSGAAALPAPPAVERVEFADIIAAAQPSVVGIEVTRRASSLERLGGAGEPLRRYRGAPMPFPMPFGFGPAPGDRPALPGERGGGGRVEGMGSGFVMDADGHVVTNHHVVEDAESVRVTFADGESVEATVVGTDDKTDLAVLKVDTDRAFEPIAFGDSDAARVGDWVVAIGSPFGLGGSVTAGIISARGRDIGAGPYDNYIQIDAPINRGNSGGPIIDATGRVIGVNTAIFSPNGGNIGIGFAIPARDAERVVAELREHGLVTRGWLGVRIQPLEQDVADALGHGDARGALVADVVAGSPADLAGLVPGDLVVRFGDAPVREPRDLSRAVARTAPGSKVRVGLLRNGDARDVTVIVDRSAADAIADAAPGNAAAGGGDLGLALAPLDAMARRRLDVPADVAGVVVAGVRPGSRAAESGLRPGDVVVRIGPRAVADPAAARDALDEARSREGRLALLVRRGPAQFYTAIGPA